MESYYFQMDELSVGYNGKPLIEHINIGVKKGEIVTLIDVYKRQHLQRIRIS